MSHELILIRHGQSQWNLENRFTGWADVDLTDAGVEEARKAGRLLKDEGYHFDLCFTSTLRRAIRTAWTILDTMDQMWIPVQPDWRLNERHYGDLQGLNKAETAQKYGDEQVKIWRRAYAIAPNPMAEGDPRLKAQLDDPRYASLKGAMPRTECLKDTVARVMPMWNEVIAPQVRAGRRLLVAAHGNSLRALVKELSGMGDEEIVEFNIPTAAPILYRLDDQLRPIERRFLGDADEIAKAMSVVSSQGSAKSGSTS